MSIDDRRAQGATRFPFEALVEVGGSLGPSFEAQAIDVSDDGMHLRTAYLPEVGQPLTCRFDASNESVMAAGEVVWNQEAGKGGEFGIRFTGLDAESAAAVARITQTNAVLGTRVRLHIDGLGSPMRARVRDSNRAELTVGSELGFLKVGKTLELEDAETGRKRPARIDRVEVEIDPESKVPQLVVALRYDVTSEDVDVSEPGLVAAAKEGTPDPTVIDGHEAGAAPDPDYESIKSASDQMKGAFARAAAKAGPAMVDFAKRAKITVALLAARRAAKKEEAAAPPRRMTSPPPGGALHASGRKVIRGDSLADAKHEADEATKAGKFPVNKRGIAIGSAAGIALLLVAVAMRKPAPPPVAAAPAEQAAPAAAAPPPPAAPDPFAPMGATLAGGAPLAVPPAIISDGPIVMNDEPVTDKHGHKKAMHVTPFGNAAVSHGNVLRLKMDGMIEKIEGASQPTGFTVMLPNRRSLEAAGPLAARDGRIGSIKVTNDGSGAELSVTFKDGVPNYQVRAKGDTLEMVLAPTGALAEKIDAPTHTKEHADVASAPKKRHGHVKH